MDPRQGRRSSRFLVSGRRRSAARNLAPDADQQAREVAGRGELPIKELMTDDELRRVIISELGLPQTYFLLSFVDDAEKLLGATWVRAATW